MVPFLLLVIGCDNTPGVTPGATAVPPFALLGIASGDAEPSGLGATPLPPFAMFGITSGEAAPPTPLGSVRGYGLWRTIFNSTTAQRRIKWRTAQRR